MIYLQHHFLLLLCALAWLMPVSAKGLSGGQQMENLEIIQRLEGFSRNFPQQKVYLHTDKDSYHAGETIWMKAYVVKGSTHMPDTLSRNLYVEMTDQEGKHISSLLLETGGGTSHADIQLPDSLPEGNYFLRAYTNWMRNFDEDLYFSKNIFVHNTLEPDFISRSDLRMNRRFNRELSGHRQQMQFGFFPESGNMVYGLESRVAFKASNRLGQGEPASGRVVDNLGREVLYFESRHNGLGVFSLIPREGEHYFAEVEFENGARETYPLPKPLPHGFAMQVTSENEDILVEVKANFDPARFGMPDQVFVLAQTRGQVVAAGSGMLENGSFSFRIDANELPPGICQITLFDGNAFPVAERLVFSDPQRVPEVGIDAYVSENEGDNVLSLDVFFDDQLQKTPAGSYSMSVVEWPVPEKEIPLNIASYLLLASDIGKSLEDPSYYLQGPDPERKQALDLLMMTHGWRRFSWEKLLAGSYPEITYGIPDGLSVGGKVRALASAGKADNVHVEMTIADREADRYATRTDEDGNFLFTGLHYYGHFNVLLNTPYNQNGRNLWIDLHARQFKDIPYPLNMHTRPNSVLSRGQDWVRVRSPRMRLRPASRARPQLGEPYFGRPDQVIYQHDIQGHYTNMIDLLRGRVTGLTIEGSRLTFRGQSYPFTDTEPLYVVDGVMVHKSTFMSVNPGDLQRIEIMRGSSAAIFGSRGGGGVLIAYTKRGEETSRRIFEFTLKGYEYPREFFQTVTDIPGYLQAGIPRTLYWEPELSPGEGGMTSVYIPAPNFGNQVVVVIEGLTGKGDPLFVRARFD